MLGTIKILKDEWKDKYLKICEQNIFSVDKRLVNGVLVLHLKNNVSPVLNDNDQEEKYVSSSDISYRPASVRRARFKRKPAIRSGSKSLSVENAEKRKHSFQFMLLKDELERFQEMSRLKYTNSNFPSPKNLEEGDHENLEEDHLYEEISARNQVDDTYLIPVDSLKRTESFLTERRKQSQSWAEEVLSETESIIAELGTSRTNSTSSSTLYYSEEPIYIELDFDTKKLIDRLVNSVKGEDFDESFDEQLKKLQYYTDVAIKRIESSRSSRLNKSNTDSTDSQESVNSIGREESRSDRPECHYSLPRNAELLENYTDENGDISPENLQSNKASCTKIEISFDGDSGHHEHLPSSTDSLHILQPKTLQEEEKKYREIVEIKQSPRSSIIEETEMKQSPSSSPKQSQRNSQILEQVNIFESPKHSPKNSPKQSRSNSPKEYWDLRKSDRQDRVNSFSSISSKGSRDSCEIRV